MLDPMANKRLKDIFEFMKLLRTLTNGSSLVHVNPPFSLANDVDPLDLDTIALSIILRCVCTPSPWWYIDNITVSQVSFEKQQELLQVWPISESYIQSLDASVACLGLKLVSWTG